MLLPLERIKLFVVANQRIGFVNIIAKNNCQAKNTPFQERRGRFTALEFGRLPRPCIRYSRNKDQNTAQTTHCRQVPYLEDTPKKTPEGVFVQVSFDPYIVGSGFFRIDMCMIF